MARWYPSDFNELWRAYEGSVSSSKRMAYEEYRTAKRKPDHLLLLKCAHAHNELYEKGVINPNKPHLATWIANEGWNAVMPRAQEMLESERSLYRRKLAAVNTPDSTWPLNVLEKLGLPEKIIIQWFLPATFIPGQPTEIRCQTRFHAKWLIEKFERQIERAVGAGTIITFVRPDIDDFGD